MFQYVILVLLALFNTLPVAYTAPVFQPHSGDATFFRPAVGACGDTNTVSDFVVAVSFEFFHSFGPQTNGNPMCDRRIQATAPCAHFDLDMSPAAFEQLADRSVGRIHAVKWHLL
ncbi:hypothetical protein JB92DRAFT_3068930 [Gautieria morchelliformis]|nr:hypothetical protein JB92DRAFT_3068930 [Gautieria morchelliformis]